MKDISVSGISEEEINIVIQKLAGEQTVSEFSETQFFKSRLAPLLNLLITEKSSMHIVVCK